MAYLILKWCYVHCCVGYIKALWILKTCVAHFLYCLKLITNLTDEQNWSEY